MKKKKRSLFLFFSMNNMIFEDNDEDKTGTMIYKESNKKEKKK